MKTTQKPSVVVAALLAIMTGIECNQAIANPLTAGDLVVLQVGLTGSGTALANKGTAVVLREFSTTGAVGQTLSLPTTASGPNNPLTISGTAGSEGALTLSGDGRYLVAAGYDVGVGASTQTTSTVGLVNASGTIDTSTTTSLLSGNNTRAAASADGSQVWVTGPGGLVYLATGTSGGTNLAPGATGVNLRTVSVIESTNSPSGVNQLFGASNNATKPAPGIVQFSTALPTSSTTGSVLSGMTPTTAPSAFAFFFANPTTLFVADSTLGLQEWIISSGTWSEVATSAGSYIGLTGIQQGNSVSLYATTGAAAGWTADNSLVSIPFTFNSGTTGIGTFGAPLILATATGASGFSGVAFAPTPEPSTFVMGALGAIGVALLRRRRRALSTAR